jgi:hypothetical protein
MGLVPTGRTGRSTWCSTWGEELGTRWGLSRLEVGDRLGLELGELLGESLG